MGKYIVTVGNKYVSDFQNQLVQIGDTPKVFASALEATDAACRTMNTLEHCGSQVNIMEKLKP